MRLADAASLTDSIRQSIFQFFKSADLASNPCSADRGGVDLRRYDMSDDYTFVCHHTKRQIYLTDVFRLHERIDENLGAGGILGILMTTIEQLIVAHILLSDAYIYRNILANGSTEDSGRSYGASTYYGRKVIFKTRANAVHVLTIPTDAETADPQLTNFFGFEKVLQSTDHLHCDMYDDALFPVALANKLVSLSAHPSQRILERFASRSIGNRQTPAI
jgi:hypothetical protein